VRMRIRPLLAAVLLVSQAVPAGADPDPYANRDPYSGAPLPPAPLQFPSPITDHFYIAVSFFYPKFNTFIRADPSQPSTVTSGTPLDGEEDLGWPARLAQARVEAMVRMRERNKLRVNYFEADRSGSVLLTNPVIFGNEVFAAGQQLESSLDWRNITVTYTYSFYRSERLEVAAGLAAYAIQTQAQAAVAATFQQQTVSASGGFPVLPLEVTWCPSRRWSFNARGAYFKANIHDFSGWLEDVHADAQYRLNPDFALGLGYSLLHASLERSSTTSPGRVDMNVPGPEAFIRFSF
jgi:hypothetical protein